MIRFLSFILLLILSFSAYANPFYAKSIFIDNTGNEAFGVSIETQTYNKCKGGFESKPNQDGASLVTVLADAGGKARHRINEKCYYFAGHTVVWFTLITKSGPKTLLSSVALPNEKDRITIHKEQLVGYPQRLTIMIEATGGNEVKPGKYKMTVTL